MTPASAWRPLRPPGPRDPVAAFPAPFVPAFARALRRRGYTFLDAEPAYPRLSAAEAARYGYGLGSFRTGEVLTPARARLWIEAAAGRPLRGSFAERDGGTVDLLRPDVEPGGFRSLAEAEALRAVTVAAIARALSEAHTLVLPLAAAAEEVDDLAAILRAMRGLGTARLLLVPAGAADLRPLAAALAAALAADCMVETAPPLSGEALAAALCAASREGDHPRLDADALIRHPAR